MTERNAQARIHHYISVELLEGEDVGLDNHTPLLDLGVLNSIEIGRLSRWLERQFDVRIPNDKMVPGNFQDIASIAEMVDSLRLATA